MVELGREAELKGEKLSRFAKGDCTSAMHARSLGAEAPAEDGEHGRLSSSTSFENGFASYEGRIDLGDEKQLWTQC
jgi:hypothetical protein